MVKVKQVFKRMLAEPHAKVSHSTLELQLNTTFSDNFNIVSIKFYASYILQVFSMFLDTLVKFIEEHGEQLDDWLFIMLLRLIHRQGTDMLSSVHFKLQIVLEHIR